MDKKKLHMIGNSHIDPVWFWCWEEGMQEVKATFASALARMREFEDFKFSCTSTAFFEWIEKICPDMLTEIKVRVQEGRFEITGGWFIEPDCLLPGGEAFVRQGLYGQRYLKKTFGKICKIGANVDSFGHSAALPQILKKSGMDAYVFMRPRLEPPVFNWESRDGSQVRVLSLPGEYTTWFHEPTVKNLDDTIARSGEFEAMVCCFGVGNHGGGPTIQNILSVMQLQKEREDVELVFSTYEEFFREIHTKNLTIKKGAFEKVNTGCYAIDAELKRQNRLTLERLIETENLLSMTRGMKGEWLKETKEMEGLWKLLLFNQFHDILGGVSIKAARDEAMMQLSAAAAKAGYIKHLALQRMVNQSNIERTTGRQENGWPLFLFNASSQDYQDMVEVELEWFCQSPLQLCNPQGEEIAYQRIHTDAKVRHTTLGGRRRLVFYAQIPAFGMAMYRVFEKEPQYCFTPRMEVEKPDPYILENVYIKAVFNTKGQLVALIEKESGYQAIKKPCSLQIYIDEREAWGGKFKSRYEKSTEEFCFDSIAKIESGGIRERVRVCLKWEGSTIEQIYTLGAQEKELHVEYRLLFTHRWRLLKAVFETGSAAVYTKAETAYATVEHKITQDTTEYNMQRFLDVYDEKDCGLAIANDGVYGFHMEAGKCCLTLARSAIYAQGESPNWYNKLETYEYTDLGEHRYHFMLKPHGVKLPVKELHRLARKIAGPYEYLLDTTYVGTDHQTFLAAVDADNVEIMLIKKAEDDDSYIVRLLELEGLDTDFCLHIQHKKYPFTIGHFALLTIKVEDDRARCVNLLEWEDEIE
jgi:alpha-mannosidase